MTTLKYSEFLRQVIEALEYQYSFDDRAAWICITVPMFYPSEEQKPHADKLKKTIKNKIDNYNKKNPGYQRSTLTLVVKGEGISGRIKWLENLVRIHESKGN